MPWLTSDEKAGAKEIIGFLVFILLLVVLTVLGMCLAP